MTFSDEKQQKTRFELEERIKELNCLYGISKLVEKNCELDGMMSEIVQLVPPAWQFPEITTARITIDNREYTSRLFKESRWSMSSTIKVSGIEAGEIEVFYTLQKPLLDEGPFLKEERNLLDAIAERLGAIIESRKAIENLKRLHQELQIKSINLEETNIALKVLLNIKNNEKDEIGKSIVEKIRLLVFPYLDKIKAETTDEIILNYAVIIKNNLIRLLSPDFNHFFTEDCRLSPSEIKVAQLIKDDKSSKEIARLLNMSEFTIYYYRKNIRRKLDIANKKINLRTYLQKLK